MWLSRTRWGMRGSWRLLCRYYRPTEGRSARRCRSLCMGKRRHGSVQQLYRVGVTLRMQHTSCPHQGTGPYSWQSFYAAMKSITATTSSAPRTREQRRTCLPSLSVPLIAGVADCSYLHMLSLPHHDYLPPSPSDLHVLSLPTLEHNSNPPHFDRL